MLSIGLSLQSLNAASVDPQGPEIVSLPTVAPGDFTVDGPEAITGGTAVARGGGVLTEAWRWTKAGVPVASSAGFTPTLGDYGETLAAQWKATETGGITPGETGWITLASGVVTGVAPAAAGALADVSYTQGTGPQVIATAGDFTGPGLSFSLDMPAPGVSVAAATGDVTISTTDPISAATVVIRAENLDGAAVSSFQVTVAAAASAPVILGLPVVTGVATVGEILYATAASVTGAPVPNRSWSWTRDGAPIAGAVAATYTLIAADEGTLIHAVQSETNSAGTDSATSAASGPVAAAAPNPEAGLTLSAVFHDQDGGTLADGVANGNWNGLFGSGNGNGFSAVFAAEVLFPVSPADGTLFDKGAEARGIWLGLRDGGTVLRLRAGDGGGALAQAIASNGSVYPPLGGVECAVIDVHDFPTDGAVHTLVWEVNRPGDRMRLWIDGVLKGDATPPAAYFSVRDWTGGSGGRWMQTDDPAYSGPGSVPFGEPTGDWPDTGAAGQSGLRVYLNQVVAL